MTAELVFFVLAFVCAAAVLGMILSKNQAHAALFIVLAFAALGGLFGLLGAPFAAAVQVIIYAGAIMVLFIFVIWMINLRTGLPSEKKRWTVLAATAIGLVLLAQLAYAARSLFGPAPSAGGETSAGPEEVGRLLFTKYLYPFEITSILILAALVGAIVLAKKKERP
ncbi:MAG: NADH-quinone oxidoreductase subunit J [Candidatus Aminicenantes bacterium]|nr:NADH-quinone oxidoreductase subunit J [Candidatus Aminicenantes bacterium]